MGVKDWAVRQAVRAAIGGQNVDKLKVFFNRYAVLISVIYVALNFGADIAVQNGMTWAGPIKAALPTLLAIIGFIPDPAVGADTLGLLAAGVALYGAGLKMVKLFKKPAA